MTATVSGTVTLPAAASGKNYAVRILADKTGGPAVKEMSGVTTAINSFAYTLAGVPTGTYFLLAFVDIDGSGGDSSTPGDFAGWYGHGGDGNPPPHPNGVVPSSGTVTFAWTLVVR